MYFTSYARLDAEGTKLTRVFERLAIAVRARLGITDREEIKALAFLDSRTIETGDQWQDRLATAVHDARVLVCFLSPTYFNSEWCAKEFAVFRRRLEQLDHGRPRPRAIIPVLWEITQLPRVVSQYQYANDRFPPSYVREGLRALCALKASRDDAEQAIHLIAEAIHDAARGGLPALRPCIDFRQLPRSFDNPGPYGIALVALGGRGPQARIGLADTIARVVDRVADQLRVPWRDLPVDGELAATVTAAAAARQVVVVLTDEASAIAEPHAGYLAELGASCVPLIVLVGRAAPPDDAAARAAVPALAGGVHAIE